MKLKYWLISMLAAIVAITIFAYPGLGMASTSGDSIDGKTKVKTKIKIKEGDVPFRLPEVKMKSEKGKTKIDKVDYYLLKKEKGTDGTEYYEIEVIASSWTKVWEWTRGDDVQFQDKVRSDLVIRIGVWTSDHSSFYAQIEKMSSSWIRFDDNYSVKNANMVAQMWGTNRYDVQRTYRWDQAPRFSPVFDSSGCSPIYSATSPMNTWDPIVPAWPVSFGAVLSEVWDNTTNQKLVDRIDFTVLIYVTLD